jgi:hypothetical protein
MLDTGHIGKTLVVYPDMFVVVVVETVVVAAVDVVAVVVVAVAVGLKWVESQSKRPKLMSFNFLNIFRFKKN